MLVVAKHDDVISHFMAFDSISSGIHFKINSAVGRDVNAADGAGQTTN